MYHCGGLNWLHFGSVPYESIFRLTRIKMYEKLHSLQLGCTENTEFHRYLQTYGSIPVAATYTYYKSICQEETLRRKGKYEQRRTQTHRERVVRVSAVQ